MGKASSAKKVARAARAGGARRPGQRRAIGFPLLIFLVVALGTLVVLFARDSRDVNASPRAGSPPPSGDGEHWHAAIGLSRCGEFVRDAEGEALVDVGEDALGIHTHGDRVVHIHPFIDSAAGRNARLRIFLDQVDVQVSDSRLEFPDGETWDEEEDTCTVDGEEVPGQLVVAKWNDAQDAADGARPNDVFTEDFGDIRFETNLEYYTIAFVPEGQLEDIPVRPNVMEDLGNLTDLPPDQNLDAPPDSVASTTTVVGEEDTTSTTAAEADASSTSTTAGATSTTAGG